MTNHTLCSFHEPYQYFLTQRVKTRYCLHCHGYETQTASNTRT